MRPLRTFSPHAWARYALTAVLLALVLLRIQPQRVAAAVSSAHPAYLAAALALTVPFLYLKALRWYAMLRAAAVEATFGEAVLSLLGGMGLALVTPARLGELVRVVYLRDPQKWKIGGLVMLDKGFDVLVLAALSAPGAWLLLGPPLGALFLLAALCGLAAVSFPGRLSAVLHRMSARVPLRSRLESAWGSLQSLRPRSTALFLALTMLAFAVVMLQYAIILLSWRAWSASVVLLSVPLVILSNVLPITVGGLGVREGVAAFLLARYGVAPSDAALAAFLSFAMNTAIPGLVGAVLPAAPLTALRPADRP
jgi:uncharacterized membrane protein YbhN (UPF0104 family)